MAFLEKLTRKIKFLVLSGIGFYQKWISPARLPCCRFYPSCSEYAKESIKQNNLAKGLRLSLWRILRCHPFAKGGYDPALTHYNIER